MAEEIRIDLIAKLDGLESGLKQANKKLDEFGKKTKKNSEKSEKSFVSMGKIAEIAIGVGVIGALTKATEAIKQFAVTSVTSFLAYERAMMSLQIQTSGAAEQLVKDLKLASDSTISTLDLISTANRALALGINQSQLPELMEVATARAKVMGITATQAFNDISIGIGRQSRLILDNLGIILDLEKAYSTYADTMDKSVESLTEFDKKTALTTQILEESRGITAALNAVQEDHLTSIDRIKASWNDFVLDTGSKVVGAFDAIANSIADANDVMGEEDRAQMDEFAAQLRVIGQEYLDVSKQSKAAEDAVKGFRAEISGIGRSTKLEGQEGAESDILAQEREINAAKRRLFELQGMDQSDLTDQEFEEMLSLNDAIAEKTLALEEAQEQFRINFTERLDILRKEKQLELDKKNTIISTFDEMEKAADLAIENFDRAQTEVANFKNDLSDLGKKAQEVEALADEFERIETALLNIGKDRGANTFLGIIARLLPQDSPFGGSANSGNAGVSVNIGTVIGTDADDIAQALREQLNGLVTV